MIQKQLLQVALIAIATFVIATSSPFSTSCAQDSTSSASKKKSTLSESKLKTVVEKGVRFLKSSQSEDGSYSGFSGIGITAIATAAMMQNGVPATDASVAKGLAFLEKQVKDDGGIYKKGSHIEITRRV